MTNDNADKTGDPSDRRDDGMPVGKPFKVGNPGGPGRNKTKPITAAIKRSSASGGRRYLEGIDAGNQSRICRAG